MDGQEPEYMVTLIPNKILKLRINLTTSIMAAKAKRKKLWVI